MHTKKAARWSCANKWDVNAEKDKQKFIENMRDELKLLDLAQVAFVSAKTGAGVSRLFG
jgi:predicted GTPase